MMDERMKTVIQAFTREQLEKFSIEDLCRLVGEAGSSAIINVKAVVKGPDGKIKYDKPELAGSYAETQEELAITAEERLRG